MTFEQEAPAVFSQLRDRLLAVIRKLPGGVHKAADVHKLTNVTAPLGWSIYRAATTRDVYEVGRYLPKRDALMKFLASASNQGVPSELVEDAKKSLDLFDELVNRHVGDREMLESVLAGLISERDGNTDLRHKRANFRSNCYLMGMTSRMTLCNIILYPGQAENSVDAVTLRGHQGLTQLHARVPMHTIWMAQTPKENQQIEPWCASEDDPHGLGLIPEYCSKPLPQITVETKDHEPHQAKLVSRGVGTSGAINYVIGNIIRDFCPASEDELLLSICMCFPPTEVLVKDVFVHERLWPEVVPRAKVYRANANPQTHVYDDSELSTVQEELEELGTGLGEAYCPDMPRYVDLLEETMARIGRSPATFRGYRCRVQYPIMNSILSIVLQTTVDESKGPAEQTGTDRSTV